MSNTLRVLHITEAYGGGVATAIDQYMSHGDLRQSLLARSRSGHLAGPRIDDSRCLTVLTRRQFLREWLRARNVEYDVVHAHSSLAGLVVRLFPHPSARVVYSPHALASSHHRNRFVRWVAHQVESRLAGQVSAFAAVGKQELADIKALRPSVPPSFIVPHAVTSSAPTVPAADRPLSVTALGRLSYQKNPESVARLPSAIDTIAGCPVKWTWIGDGDPWRRDLMEQHGWTVTGWLPHAEAMSLVANTAVLLHPARYEGMPLAVLEAMAAATPVVAADIVALQELNSPWRYSCVPEAIEIIRTLLGDTGLRVKVGADCLAELTEKSTKLAQGAALSRLYDAALRTSITV